MPEEIIEKLKEFSFCNKKSFIEKNSNEVFTKTFFR
jgi:hypothetical protein